MFRTNVVAKTKARFVKLRANFYSWIFSHIGVTVIAQLLTVLRWCNCHEVVTSQAFKRLENILCSKLGMVASCYSLASVSLSGSVPVSARTSMRKHVITTFRIREQRFPTVFHHKGVFFSLPASVTQCACVVKLYATGFKLLQSTFAYDIIFAWHLNVCTWFTKNFIISGTKKDLIMD